MVGSGPENLGAASHMVGKLGGRTFICRILQRTFGALINCFCTRGATPESEDERDEPEIVLHAGHFLDLH